MISLDYTKYKNFGVLCEVPKDILDNLLSYYEIVSRKTMPDQGNGAYKQWHIQRNTGLNESEEIKWSRWIDNGYLDLTKSFFDRFVSNIVKFRFSFLQKTHTVDYHAKHSLPRIHIPLSNSKSIFVIKDNNGIEHEYELEYGKAHFVNTTLLHKVVTIDSVNRLNSFFCFYDFVDEKIKEQFLR